MKKVNKILCMALGATFLATGCATVGNITNKENEIIYNGNAGVVVDGNLYFGNSVADYSASGFSYKDAKTYAYLARLNQKIDLDSKSGDYSPKGVENVASEVVGQSHSFMFALGNYLYYATPNQKEFSDSNGKPAKHFEYTTLFRCKLNGDKNKEVYTTEGEVSKIEVLKYGDDYYVVMLAGSKLVRINVGSAKKAKADVSVLAEDVTSVAIPKTFEQEKTGSSLDWNGYVYFTVAKTDEDNSDVGGTIIKRIKLDSKEAEELEGRSKNESFAFVGREKDVVFYTCKKNGTVAYTYASDLTGDNSKMAILNKEKEVYTSALSDFAEIVETRGSKTETAVVGYMCLNSSTVMVAKKNSNGFDVNSVSFTADGSAVSSYKILAKDERVLYLGTTTGIYRADLSYALNGASSVACQTVTKMTSIYDKAIASYDGEYVYFYAKLEEVKEEDKDTSSSEEETEKETDDNYYLYRTKVNKTYLDENKNYELLSLTKIKSRRTENQK